MGRVYLARPADESPGLVALKVIRPEYAEDPSFRRRFEREASVHARLRTPHTPRLCGTGFEDELLWMATEYLPGFDLAEAVREDGTLETAAVWRLVGELGRALAGLAVEGIVHRDLKPSNVLLSVRGAHVIDFGISKAADASAITGTGNRVGTPAYMSPEHLREGRSDTASDVFSLAGTLAYAVTGRAPFGDGTGVDVMHRVAFEEPHPEVIGEISAADPELGALLTACLAKEPAQRPTPQQLIAAAGAHAVPSDWPEPLNAKVQARQRAYETLLRLPAAGTPRLRSAGDPSAVPAARTPEPRPPVARAAPAASPSAEKDPDATPTQRSGAARTPARNRRKPLLIAAAALSTCAVGAAAFLLTGQDHPATASPETGVTAAVGVEPGAASTAPASPGASAHARPDVDGAAVENRGGTTATASPGAEPSASPAGGRVNASAPGTAPDASPSATPSSAPPSPVIDTPPWLSECTYYAGKARTRLGDTGKRVQQVQCMLSKRGYSEGSTDADGEFGAGTQAAVQTFQSDRDLKANGVVRPDTWNALRTTD
ncbi:protein kinase [Streptomyces sp. NBC_00199]|uniref:protein kinase domain-containing protein n=1 Tax=Streptomyces sp. NBC_00199 TaxID=2975678 RepID=UPI00224E78C9|nr:protein kinase [Streptomyces sp. NBC_00199]MCX5263132.1 protein kinase [Streptomyces sp. NBC_00199]